MDEFCCLNYEISDRLYSIPWKTSYNVKAEQTLSGSTKTCLKPSKSTKAIILSHDD